MTTGISRSLRRLLPPKCWKARFRGGAITPVILSHGCDISEMPLRDVHLRRLASSQNCFFLETENVPGGDIDVEISCCRNETQIGHLKLRLTTWWRRAVTQKPQRNTPPHSGRNPEEEKLPCAGLYFQTLWYAGCGYADKQ